MSKVIASNKILVIILLCILFAQILMPNSSGLSESKSNQPAASITRTPEFDSAKTTSLGEMTEGTIKFAIGFSTRNDDKLQNFIDSSRMITYGVQNVLTEEEFETEYSPHQADYDQVLSYLSAHNINVTATSQNRLLINAVGTVDDVATAFETQIGLYSYQNITFYSSSQTIAVPSKLNSCNIAGIDINSFPAQPFLTKVSDFAEPAGLAYNKAPSEFRSAYGISTAIGNGWTGAGQTIGIVDAYGDPTIVSDVNAFNSLFGLPALSLTINGTGGSDSGWATETALDVEWAHAMAPEAAIILQLAPDNYYSSLFQAINTLVQQTNPPDIISLSFGGEETNSYSHILAAAAAKGIKVFVSTGDSGAYNGGSNISVQYPASDPNVIAVGGTTLYSNTVQGTNQYFENGWSGSGGGYSNIFLEPAFQANAGIPNTSGMRAIPDICLDADPASGVTIYIDGDRQTGWGGTSLSAPLMAGIASVALDGNWNLDNNAFYSIYGTNRYNVSFHDVYRYGNNGYYSVQTGWDAVTGLGSINFHNFASFFGVNSDISLTNPLLDSSSVVRGSTLTTNYSINNPSSYSLIQIGLGTSIRLHGTINEINDTSNDIYVKVLGGDNTLNRQFATSPTIAPGSYDVSWNVWMGPPGYGTLLASSGWWTDQLQILSSSTEFDFQLSASPNSQTIAPEGSATYNITSTLTSGTSTLVSLSCTNVTSDFSFIFNQQSGNPTFTSTFTVQSSPIAPHGNYTFIINGTGEGKNHYSTITLNIGDNYEPDDSFSQFSSMTVTTSLQHQLRSIEPAGDNDYIRFYASPGTYTFYTNSSMDTYGYLYDSDQKLLTYDDDLGGNFQFRINFQILESGYYYLRVKNLLNISTGNYTLYYNYIPAPSAPTQITPTNNYVNASNNALFRWSNSTDATSYQIEISGPSPGIYNTTSTSFQLTFLTEGTYTWHVRAYNINGWSDWSPTWTFILDLTPPTIPNPDDGFTGWLTNNTPTFNWSANDSKSGVAGYYWRVDNGPETWTTTKSVILTPQTDGTHIFYVKSKDNAANNSTYGSFTFQIDTIQPFGSISISQTSAYTTSVFVTLFLTFTDQTSGIDKVRFSNDGVWDTEPWENPFDTKAWSLTIGDGLKTVYYQVKDAAGLQSITYSSTITLDTSPPSGSVQINNEATYTSSALVTLSLTATDATSGINQVRFSNNGVWDNTQWETPKDSRTWTLSTGDGSKTVYYQIKDNAGLIFTATSNIILDTTPPSGSITIENSAQYINNTTVNLTLSLSDNNSNAATMRFSNDNVTWSDWQNFSISKTWQLPNNDAIKVVYVQFRDNAGLTSIYDASIVLDMTTPTPDAGSSQTITLGNSVVLNGSNSTDNSGIASYHWDFDDGTTATGVTTNHTYSSIGTYITLLTVKDVAGNTASTTKSIIVLAQPSESISPSTSSTTNPTTSQTSTPTPKPTSTPTPSATKGPITVFDGSTELFTVSGNITTNQISNAKIQVDQTAKITTLSFTVTGENGTFGFGNITVTKNEIHFGTKPTVFIDNEIAENQGFTQDGNNYYVWFTIHFSIHSLSVVFSSGEKSTTIDSSTLTISAIAVVIVCIALAIVTFLLKRRKTPT